MDGDTGTWGSWGCRTTATSPAPAADRTAATASRDATAMHWLTTSNTWDNMSQIEDKCACHGTIACHGPRTVVCTHAQRYVEQGRWQRTHTCPQCLVPTSTRGDIASAVAGGQQADSPRQSAQAGDPWGRWAAHWHPPTACTYQSNRHPAITNMSMTQRNSNRHYHGTQGIVV